jgi:hypothetical protein
VRRASSRSCPLPARRRHPGRARGAGLHTPRPCTWGWPHYATNNADSGAPAGSPTNSGARSTSTLFWRPPARQPPGPGVGTGPARPRDRPAARARQRVAAALSLVFHDDAARPARQRGPRRAGRHRLPERIWIMDRGIPTDELLTGLRTAESGVRDLVGPPQTHLTRDEAALTASRACAAVGSKPPGNAAANSRGRARPATRCSRNPAPRRKKPAVARPAWCKSRSRPTVPSRLGWSVLVPCSGALPPSAKIGPAAELEFRLPKPEPFRLSRALRSSP